jgi:DNA-binding PadR family transcriptional regulator
VARTLEVRGLFPKRQPVDTGSEVGRSMVAVGERDGSTGGVVDALGVPDFVLLGLLAEEDRHAYQLDQIIEAREIRSWVGISFPSIYRVAKDLEHRGLVSSSAVMVSGRPNRRLLSLTEVGRAALSAKILQSLADAPGDRALISLALMFGSAVPRRELRGALERMRVGLAECIERLAAKRAGVAEQWADPLIDGIFACELAELEARSTWAGGLIATLADDTGWE